MDVLYLVAYDRRVRAVVILLLVVGTASADTSKLAKDATPIQPREVMRGKDKLCCGYPLVDDQQWALCFYWLATEESFQDLDSAAKPGRGPAIPADSFVDLYTPEGWFLQRVSERFAWNLRLEGSGLMMDGRVVNYRGKCDYGYGTCFAQLDTKTHPFGKGAGWRAIVPFKSVAVDRDLVPIGTPLYIPEFDGMQLPDGSIHDGCVRADDTGGGIKKRKMDFFVVTYGNFRFLLEQLLGVNWITPHVQAPRCQYLLQR
ncbi:hypothetical protein BH11MYX2_BH11MYX2_05410 [soil metagenome]